VNATSGLIHRGIDATPDYIKNPVEHAWNRVEGTPEYIEHHAIRVVNGKPNVLTTTIAPRTTGAPPAEYDHWNFLGPALLTLSSSFFQWVPTVVGELFLVSCAFAIAELLIAAGRHWPSHQTGCIGPGVFAWRLLHDVARQWSTSMALLVAIWTISIIMPSLMKGHAERVRASLPQEDTLRNLQVVVAFVGLALCGAIGFALAWRECPEGGRGALKEEEGEAGYEPVQLQKYAGLGQDEEKGCPCDTAEEEDCSPSYSRACCLCSQASVAAALLLDALERPLVAGAVGATYKSAAGVQFLVGLLPWSYVAPSFLGYRPHSPYEILIPVVALGVVVGYGLYRAKRIQLSARN
jgi:hypothetical protein